MLILLQYNKEVLFIQLPYGEIKEVHNRWYQLKDTAVEIFLVTGRTYLIAFNTSKVQFSCSILLFAVLIFLIGLVIFTVYLAFYQSLKFDLFNGYFN